MKYKKSICFIIATPKAHDVIMEKTAGGGEKQAFDIAKALKEKGYNVSLIIEKSGIDRIVEEVIYGMKTIYIPSYRGLPIVRTYYPYLKDLFDSIKIINADIYFQMIPGFVSGVLAIYLRKKRKRFILYNSSDILSTPDYKKRYSFFSIPWVFLGLKKSSILVSQQKVQYKNFLKYFGRKTYIVESLMNIKKPHKILRKYFIWVGSNTLIKQQKIIWQIAEELKEIRFVIVSNSFYSYKKLPNVECRTGLSDEELFALYNESIGIINTSVTEGIPNTFLEQWMMGGKAISLNADIAGLLKNDSELGKCFYGDITELKKYIVYLWDKYGNTDYICRECMNYVDKMYNKKYIIKKWIKIIENV